MSMKLVIAIVQNEDNQKLNNALVKEGFRSTRLATSGGFLRTGNTTVMIGVEESKLEEVLGIIESVCKARKQTVSAVAPSVDTTGVLHSLSRRGLGGRGHGVYPGCRAV